MSKGPGKLQQQILQRVTTTTPISVNQLCWDLALSLGRVKQENTSPLPTGTLDPSFYKSFCRAVGLLKKRDLLQYSTKTIETTSDIIALYPYRTQDVQIRALRERLLPIAVEYIGSLKPAFNVQENEYFLLRRLSHIQQKEFSKAWGNLWNELTVLLGKVPESRRKLVFDLMVKGNELSATPVSLILGSYKYSGDSMERLLSEAIKVNAPVPSEADLYKRVRELYTKFFPRSDRMVTKLKSRLVAVVEMTSNKGKPTMTDGFKEELLNKNKAFVEALPGHQETETKEEWLGTSYRKISYSPLLDQLILRDVFRPFEFLAAKF